MKKIKAKKMATGGLMSMPPYIAKQDEEAQGITPYDVNTPRSARGGLPSRAMDKTRTRFNKGGEAFPDLSGDGDVTQKDILIGKGVIKKAKGGIMQRQKFASGDVSTKEIVEMRKMEQLEAMQDSGLPLTDDQEKQLEEYKASKNIKSQQMALGGMVGVERGKYDQRPDYQAYAEGDIIPKLVATEFTDDGEVEGPGTGTSDSIPALLSDGEFVFTAKAVKNIGVDKLRKMMKQAEESYDAGNQSQEEEEIV